MATVELFVCILHLCEAVKCHNENVRCCSKPQRSNSFEDLNKTGKPLSIFLFVCQINNNVYAHTSSKVLSEECLPLRSLQLSFYRPVPVGLMATI